MTHRGYFFCALAGLVALSVAFACETRQAPTGPSGTPVNSSPALSPVGGRVMEPGNFGLPSAQVALIGGTMDGRSMTADQYGDYTFADGGNALQVRAMKDGYVTSTQTIGTDRTRTDIVLTPTVPYASAGGDYRRVTFTASASCQLPDDAKKRTYSATVTQDGARLTINVSGPQFTGWIHGRTYGNAIDLTMGAPVDDDCQYYHQCFIDDLGNGRTFTLSGTASGTIAGSLIDTQLAGAVTVTGAPPVGVCTAPDHHLTFSR